MIAIYPSGTPVKLKTSELDGLITEARIIGEMVMYLVAYFENGAYTEKWLYEFQFAVTGPVTPRTVGFLT